MSDVVGSKRRLLLDTCALLWWAAEPTQLSAVARAAIADSSSEVFVSAASGWEIATKVRLGKLADPAGVVPRFSTYLAAQGFVELPIGLEAAVRAGDLRIAHKDPFDRVLMAQSVVHGLELVTNESFGQFGVRCLW